jgi:hypothetical protein
MQTAGQSSGYGAFANASLAAADSDNVVNVQSDATTGVLAANGGVDFDAGLKFRSSELDALTNGGFQLFGFRVGRCWQFDPNARISPIHEGIANHPQVTQRPLGAGFDNV